MRGVPSNRPVCGTARCAASPLACARPVLPADSLIEPRQVRFPAADGLMVHGQLFEPAAEYGEDRPALVFFHGGSRRQMLLGWHYSSYYHACYAFNQYMASRGFVVLSVNYRSGIGYGLDFREPAGYGASGASEFQDVLGAGLFLRSMPRVDGDAIAAWGGSYGGYLTALALARASDLFAAGVDVHGVHDWRRTIKNFVPSYNALEDPESARLAFESLALGVCRDLALAGPPGARRRRSQCAVRGDGGAGGEAAGTGGGDRDARSAGRGTRFSAAFELARGLSTLERVPAATIGFRSEIDDG